MPNVNTIIVLKADRFGIRYILRYNCYNSCLSNVDRDCLSALYQLRGRVGRSTRQAFAYFMTVVNNSVTIEAENRLNYLKTYTELGNLMNE